MRIQNLLSRFSILLVPFLISCGSGVYLNKNYSPQTDRELTLSVLPILDDVPVDVNSIFQDTFKDIYVPYAVKNFPYKLYENAPDSGMINIILTIQNIEYKSDDLKKGSNLSDYIPPGDLNKFKDAIGNPDLLLVPMKFSLKEFINSVHGKIRIRLYDFQADRLIYESYEYYISVGPDGEPGSGGVLPAMGVGTKVSDRMIGAAEECAYLLAEAAFKDINKEVFNISE
ncbi:MAG: hypothetical protein JSW64_14385 [Candidatus Zixiibacteriota bacterium]|nr:MAG: hypothetical protein JSW64_14385 [candidate division Zixibacteria bacterium]